MKRDARRFAHTTASRPPRYLRARRRPPLASVYPPSIPFPVALYATSLVLNSQHLALEAWKRAWNERRKGAGAHKCCACSTQLVVAGVVQRKRTCVWTICVRRERQRVEASDPSLAPRSTSSCLPPPPLTSLRPRLLVSERSYPVPSQQLLARLSASEPSSDRHHLRSQRPPPPPRGPFQPPSPPPAPPARIDRCVHSAARPRRRPDGALTPRDALTGAPNAPVALARTSSRPPTCRVSDRAAPARRLHWWGASAALAIDLLS